MQFAYTPEEQRQLAAAQAYAQQGLGAPQSAPVQPAAPQAVSPAPRENFYKRAMRGLGAALLPVQEARALGLSDAEIADAQRAARKQFGLGMLTTALQGGGDPYGRLNDYVASLRQQQTLRTQRNAKPAAVAEFEYAEVLKQKDPEAYQRWVDSRRAQNLPTSFAEVERAIKDPNFLEKLREIAAAKIGAPYTQTTQGGAEGAFDKREGTFTPSTTLEQEAAAARTKAAETASGRVTGEKTAEAQAALPKVIQKSEAAIELVGKLRNHPGRKDATGASRMTGVYKIPGTNAYDFETMRKQIAGQVFLEAFESLKGGGQITVIEGEKAEQAMARMDAAQSEEAFLAALDDFEKALRRGVELARQKAGTGEAAVSPPANTNLQDAAKAELERRRSGRK